MQTDLTSTLNANPNATTLQNAQYLLHGVPVRPPPGHIVSSWQRLELSGEPQENSPQWQVNII
jgi:hypothetical protein